MDDNFNKEATDVFDKLVDFANENRGELTTMGVGAGLGGLSMFLAGKDRRPGETDAQRRKRVMQNAAFGTLAGGVGSLGLAKALDWGAVGTGAKKLMQDLLGLGDDDKKEEAKTWLQNITSNYDGLGSALAYSALPAAGAVYGIRKLNKGYTAGLDVSANSLINNPSSPLATLLHGDEVRGIKGIKGVGTGAGGSYTAADLRGMIASTSPEQLVRSVSATDLTPANRAKLSELGIKLEDHGFYTPEGQKKIEQAIAGDAALAKMQADEVALNKEVSSKTKAPTQAQLNNLRHLGIQIANRTSDVAADAFKALGAGGGASRLSRILGRTAKLTGLRTGLGRGRWGRSIGGGIGGALAGLGLNVGGSYLWGEAGSGLKGLFGGNKED